MDPDIVRQQEEAERAASGLAPKRPAHGPSGPIQSRHPVSPGLGIPQSDAPDDAVFPLDEPQLAPPKEMPNPNRRALPPMGTGRRFDEEPKPRRRVRGLLRLLLYAIGGAALGAGAGFIGVKYFDLFVNQTEFFISCMAGGFALLFGLTHLLHYDHS